MTLQIGSHLKGRYRIDHVIARGGMGAIYAAFDESLSVRVAVKENLFTSEDATRQFRREATILASLRHSNLPRVTDHFVIPDQGQYLVMDFIDGEDLKDRISRTGTLPEEEVALVGLAISDALNYMHTRKPPIVHRDIKPGNIKITPNGEIFLVDFGIAKVSQPGKNTTIGAQSLTPGFAPPEQYGQGTDARTDIYALGATLYLALTGTIPANGLARMMQQETLAPILQTNPQTSPELAAVIEKSLAVQKEDRFQTTEELLQALMAAHHGAREKRDSYGAARVEPAPTVSASAAVRSPAPEPAALSVKSAPAVPEKKAKRKNLPFLIGGAFLAVACILAAMAVFVFNLLPSDETSRAPLAAVSSQTASPTTTRAAFTPTQEAIVASPAVEQNAVENVALDEPVSDTATPKPEQSPTPVATPVGGGAGQILFVSDRTGSPQLFIVNQDGSNLQQITSEMDGACQPDWSPDGERIVFVSPCRVQNVVNPQAETYRGSTLFVINADGTNLIPVASFPGGDFDPAWSPDGSQIVFTTYRDNLSASDLNLYLYNIENNQVTALTSDLNTDRHPAWSPAGDQIIFQRQPQGVTTQINMMQADGSGITIFSDQQLTNAFMPDWSVQDTVVFSRGNPFPSPVTRSILPRNAQEVQLSPDPAWDLDFSSDGHWLVFERVVFQGDGSRNHDIYRMSSLGGSGIQLTDDPARDYQPIWRPVTVSITD